MNKPLCIYHANCADGFTAAWAVGVGLALSGDAIEFHPAIYGQLPPGVAGRHVIIVDFSYPADTIKMMAGTARSILVLDHHKTAQADLAEFAPPRGGGWHSHLHDISWAPAFAERGNVRALFDMERSGAQIAWDFFNPGTARPLLVDYVGDRDLWRFALPSSREVNAYISAVTFDMAEWGGLARYLDNQLHEVVSGGEAIELKRHKDVAELTQALRRRMRIGGHEVWVANLPYTLASDAANLMAKGEPFAATYCDTPAGRSFSLRSTPDGLDVSAIAKGYGGGGHRNAAGFLAQRGWEGDA